jgi:hypothetical protein
MKKSFITVIFLITVHICLSAQISAYNTDTDFIKGRVKKMETYYYHPDKHKTKILSEYDSSGRIIYKASYYDKKNPSEEFFYYDSIGNINLHIYNKEHYKYEYMYNNSGQITRQLKLKDETFFEKIDSIIYNEENLPAQYIMMHPYSKTNIHIDYSNVADNVKRISVKEEKNNRVADTCELLYYYNGHGFYAKKIRKSIIHINLNGMENHPYSHIEEYEYVDYKYDRQGNWVEYKCYLNWKGKGKQYHLKAKRKIMYY